MLTRLNDVTVVSITTVIRRLDSEVRLARDEGLPSDCVINCDQIHTLPRHKLGDRICELSPSKLKEVEQALLYALGFRSHK